MARVGDYALLEDDAEGLPEFSVGLGLVLAQLRQRVEHFFREAVLYLSRLAVLLEHFARDVEREVLGIYDAFDEAHIFRYELLAVVHYEHAADVELHAVLAVLIEKVHRRARRDEEQRAEFAHALGLVVDALERVFPVVRDVAVEFVEFLVRYLFLRARPERLHRVDGLFLFVLFVVLRILDVNRVGYEVGVFLDDAAYRPLGEVVLELFAVVVLSGGLHVQRYRRAVCLARAAVYRVGAVAGRFPLPAF